MNRPYSSFVRRSNVSEDGPPPVPEGIITGPQANEEPAIIATPCHSRILAPLTMYDELSAARVPEEFRLVQTRLRQEWTFNGGFVSRITIVLLNSQIIITRFEARRPCCVSFFPLLKFEESNNSKFSVNAAMFAITADSIFKVNTYAYTAVAISSAACGLGITCDVWFLLRYSWVDLGTFIVRTVPNTTTSHIHDIIPRSAVLVTYMVHTSSFPCPHACPPSARWFLLSPSCRSRGSSHMVQVP